MGRCGCNRDPQSLHCRPLTPGSDFWVSPGLGPTLHPQGRGSQGCLPYMQALQSGLSGSRTHPGQAAPGLLPFRTEVMRGAGGFHLVFVLLSAQKVELLCPPVCQKLPRTLTQMSSSDCEHNTHLAPDFPPELFEQKLHFQETLQNHFPKTLM